MRGEFVDAVEIEVEFDEAREGGLVERIGGDGAGERGARVVGGVDVDEALRDREKVFRAKVGLVEIIGEKKARGFVVVETEVREGEEAVDDWGEAGGPVGILLQERLAGGDGSVEIARDDERFDGENRVGLPRKFVRGGVFAETASEGNIAGVGREIGECEQCGRIGREVADK